MTSSVATDSRDEIVFDGDGGIEVNLMGPDRQLRSSCGE